MNVAAPSRLQSTRQFGVCSAKNIEILTHPLQHFANKHMRYTPLLSRPALTAFFNGRSRSIQKFSSEAFLVVDIFSLAYYVLAFYPGYLTGDSIYMLSQGAGNQPISNWHPPFITITWGLLYGIFKSAGGIWIFQVALFILAAHFFSAGLRNKIVALLCHCLILIYPPIVTNMAALWKDDWVIIFTLFCAGFALRGIKSHSLLHAHAAGFFFVLASLTRIDYLIVALPFAFGAFLSCEKKDCSKWYKRTSALGLMLYLFVLIAGSQLAGTFVEKRLNPWATIAIWDIAGISNGTESKNPLPGYYCTTSDPLVFGEHRLYSITLPEEPDDKVDEAMEIPQAWLDAITSHPTAYINHRLCVAKQFFGLKRHVHYPYPSPVFVKSPLSQSAERSPLNLGIYWFYDSHAHGLMFRYCVYLMICFIITGMSYRTRSIDLFQLVLLASIFMSAARFIILPASDFRYGLWMVVGTILLIAVFMDGMTNRIRTKISSMEINDSSTKNSELPK